MIRVASRERLPIYLKVLTDSADPDQTAPNLI